MFDSNRLKRIRRSNKKIAKIFQQAKKRILMEIEQKERLDKANEFLYNHPKRRKL